MRHALHGVVALALVGLLAAAALATESAPREGAVPSSDGVMIHYALAGDGPVALVFVHGWSCDATYWADQVRAFTPRYRVVTLDLAGHGQSGRERQDWTIAAFGQDVRAVVEQLDLKRAILIGHSMGGPVVVAAAGLMPERVIGVIGVDTMQDVAREIPPQMLEMLLGQMRSDFPAFTAAFVRGMFPAGADTALVSRVAEHMASAPPEIAIPAFEGLFAYDLKAGFSAVKAPIREINSQRNPTNVEGNRTFAADFDAVTMEGVGHFPQLERPAEFDRILGELADAVSARGAKP